MFVPLLLRREHIDLHLDLSTTCHKTNLQLFVNTLMKILKMVSFNILNLQLVALFSLLRKMMVPCHCVLIIIELIHHKNLIPSALNLKIVGSITSGQGVHQDWFMWSIQLGAYLKRGGWKVGWLTFCIAIQFFVEWHAFSCY
jgi:hypothetical protein